MQKSTFIQMFKAPTLIEEDFLILKKSTNMKLNSVIIITHIVIIDLTFYIYDLFQNKNKLSYNNLH